jgi:hypothetical protein
VGRYETIRAHHYIITLSTHPHVLLGRVKVILGELSKYLG